MTLVANIKKRNLSAGLGDGFVTITDALNPESPIKKRAGETYTCEAAPSFGRAYDYGYYTGQVSSYRTGDDGWMLNNYWKNLSLPEGLLNRVDPNDKTKVVFINEFGNFNLWTDTVGGQTYANGIYVNHVNGMGYLFGSILSAQSWNDLIDDALGTDFGGSRSSGGYTDWFLWNRLQHFQAISHEEVVTLNYPPLNITSGDLASAWTSTNLGGDPDFAFIFTNTFAISTIIDKTDLRMGVAVRKFLPLP